MGEKGEIVSNGQRVERLRRLLLSTFAVSFVASVLLARIRFSGPLNAPGLERESVPAPPPAPNGLRIEHVELGGCFGWPANTTPPFKAKSWLPAYTFEELRQVFGHGMVQMGISGDRPASDNNNRMLCNRHREETVCRPDDSAVKFVDISFEEFVRDIDTRPPSQYVKMEDKAY